MKKNFTLIYFILFSSPAFTQTSNFTWQSINGPACTPSSIKFTQVSSGSPTGYIWLFGNNTGSNSANPTASYTTSGTFTVKLIVIYKKSTVTVTKTIVINPAVVARFVIDRNNICTPGSIRFTANLYQHISSYEWNFGDNTPVVSTTNATITHDFSSFGNYPISLKVTLNTGCNARSFTTIKVQRPIINATVSKVSGCIPAMVRFNAVTELPLTSTVTSYAWNFGDESPVVNTTTASVSHTYLAAGNYTASLHIITNDGCSADYTFREIAFGMPPTNHIAYAKKTTFCGSEAPSFVSKAVNANRYFWDFGEGDTTSVNDTTVRHKFKTLGTKTIIVTPFFNECPGTPISLTVNVIGVIAGFDYSNTCSDKKQFMFNNTSQGNQSTIAWEFGDGISPVLNSHNIVHTFADTGTFITRLRIIDSITSCEDTYFFNIYTANPLLTNPDTSICKNSTTTFSIPQNYNNPAALYNWNVLGIIAGPGSTVPFSIPANVHGIFNNNFVVINNGRQYCPDTIQLNKNIIVRGPLLNFDATASLCVGKEYSIANLSRPYFSSDPIHNWQWNYGITGHRDSVFQPLPYFFPYWGTYYVRLTATDVNGCTDTLVKPVIAYDIPFLRSIPDIDTLCAGQSATLIAFHNDPIIWSPSNALSCTTCDTIAVNPQVTTTYYVKATSRFNCTVTDSISIIVHKPFTAVTKKTDNYICQDESVQLSVFPGLKKISWNPTTGLSDSTVLNPVASPKQSTVYVATLTDPVGCFSSAVRVNVYVKSLPTVNAGPDKIVAYNTGYSFSPVYSNNVNSYNWSPANLLSCSNCANPAATANGSQTYTLTVTSDSGCVARDKISVFVECNGANLLLPTAFTPNNDNLNDYYYPIARGIKKITRFSIYDRQGQLVFEAKDFVPNNKSAGWDGRIKGTPQNSATYVYFIESVCETGQPINMKGSFVLIR